MIDTVEVMRYTPTMDAASIRRLRAHLNVTQQEFADLLLVSRVTISYWENGRSAPLPMAQKLLRDLADQTYGPLVSE